MCCVDDLAAAQAVWDTARKDLRDAITLLDRLDARRRKTGNRRAVLERLLEDFVISAESRAIAARLNLDYLEAIGNPTASISQGRPHPERAVD